MKRKLFWTYVILLDCMLFLCGLYFCVSGNDFSAGQIEKSRKIGACYMTMNNTYFEILNKEIESVVEEKGDILITRDPALDADKQAEQIYDMIDQGVEAIFITPVDWEQIQPALRTAKEKGIKIMVVDSALEDEMLADCTVLSDNYDVGVQTANYLMSQKESAKIVLLEHKNAKSSIDRMQGFQDAIRNHKNYQIVAIVDCNGKLEEAMPVMQEVISSGISFDTVFAVNDPSALGALAAIRENAALRDICMCGVDGSPDAKSMIKENRMMSTMAQFPREIGEKAAESMYDLLEGKKCEKEILVPVKLIAKFNINGYDTDKW